MIEMLNSILLNDEEFHLGSDIWTADKVRFDDPFPEDFSEQLHKKHQHILSGDADKQEGWDDCLDDEEEEEI